MCSKDKSSNALVCFLSSSGEHLHYRAKSKGSICLLYKWADTVFWLFRAVQWPVTFTWIVKSTVTVIYPANTRLWPNTGPMLVHRLRRWPNIGPALGEYLVFAGYYASWTPGELRNVSSALYSTLKPISATKIVFNPFYLPFKLLSLGAKRAFKHRNLQMSGPKLIKYE